MNRFGLKRRPPSSVRRQIRRQSGFGCVMCGFAIGDYEHVDPTYAEAKIHDPSCMTFLCIQCHGKVTRGQLSKESVKRAMSSPAALKAGFSFEALDVGLGAPTIYFGPMSARECESIIVVNSRPIFSIRPAERDGGPIRISAEIRDYGGKVIFSIADNVWRVQTDNWDVEIVGNTTTIRNGPSEIALVIRTEPPGELYVERMNMSIEGYRFWIESRNLFIRLPNSDTQRVQKLDFVGCKAAIVADGGGIKFGVGGGSVGFTMQGIGQTGPKIDVSRRRNSECPCGSGNRYKKCCGNF